MTYFKFKIEEFDPQIASEERLDNFLIFNEEILQEINPDDPLPARDFRKQMLRTPHPHYKQLRWIMFPNDGTEKIIGCVLIALETDESPSYTHNAHIIYGGVSVCKDYRQQGIGTTLFKKLVDEATELGKTTIQAETTLEVGHRFCDKMGGSKAIEIFNNRLVLDSVNWEMVKQWKEEGPERAPGVTIETVREIPEKDIAEFSELLTEVVNQQPLGELESRHKTTPASIRSSEKLRKEKGIEYITMITREKDGAISGMTSRFYNPEEPYKIHIHVTGVRKKYRGRKLGKWLKAEMLLYIKEMYPTVKYEVTRNTTINTPMLLINEALGYKPHSSSAVYKFNVAELVEELGN